ncbi:MAG: FAD-binding oxidoreductase, partial [Thermomicrobiales bacterium]
MAQNNVISQLIAIAGADSVFHEPSDLIVYEYDGSVDGAVETARPIAVVLPRTTQQVSDIVKLAKRSGLPITPRGAGTGLSGGAVSQAGGIVIGLSRMSEIIEVDPIDRTALVEPGVINLELSEFTTSY